MSPAWPHLIILHLASLLTPRGQRAGWIEEWKSELWYIPRSRATAFCMGAFQDALWLRRHRHLFEERARFRLNSALSCLALLAALAASAVFFAFQVIPPRLTPASPLKVPDLAGICIGIQLLSCVLLLAMLWVWMPACDRYSASLSSTLRRVGFLVLKILLLQSIILSASLILLFLKPLEGFTAALGGVGVVLAWRWVITDQQRRCPMCLRLLTSPIVIGTPSRTFLEWYGAESACPHGHGLLLTSEIPSSYSKPQWISLDESWSDLFGTPAQHRARSISSL